MHFSAFSATSAVKFSVSGSPRAQLQRASAKALFFFLLHEPETPTLGAKNGCQEPISCERGDFGITPPLWDDHDARRQATFSTSHTNNDSRPRCVSYEDFGDGCDWILARDESNPEAPLERRRVLRKFVRTSPTLHLKAGGQTIDTTDEHPFYELDRGWTKAVELKPGDVLVSHTGEQIVVTEMVATGRVAKVYNLEVEGCHTYFVGSASWGFSVWAHNANNTCIVGAYDMLEAEDGSQLHHLLQQKAFPDAFNAVSGPVVSVEGSTGTLNSQHNLIHRVLEGFWEPFRRAGNTPTARQYMAALNKALVKAEFTAKESYKLANSAERFLGRIGLTLDSIVPNVPGKFPGPFLPGGPIT